MMQDTRRAPRRQPSDLVPVIDMLSEAQIGRVGNVSETGMLLLASAPLRDDALYQLRFSLPERSGRSTEIDVGVHLLWTDAAHAPGQAWAGFRFLSLSEPHRLRLRAWIAEEHLVG
ncbi:MULTISPECIES: PilZ domain-containing protein [Xanthomonas]|uniref:PilZ domain-containing protein n=1 Tax=Xanthomonas cucurbitae TaxID=56453 RepID=A0A2S7DUU5_9XANT|nr:PilZ domain-containing protein [Xanthomonas cucurbitae]PPU77604.1 pilus assembly protein PilZ [Xanthomonas cucurbitae]QHG88089.1 PilZ domain-containing protein [Xanthomonas cucurbitae]WDM66945.1 PilZ domain-containing protein [Xanthomonas cucurbitae]WDM70821.1 PilZ domain-containing protein [Xanthomonas cucurbitae]WDM74647.1 PilZ domain-containing protein [Xanthomonas cucurbitae]